MQWKELQIVQIVQGKYHPCSTYIIISSLCNQRRLCFVLSFCNYFSSYRIKQQIESSLLNKFQEDTLRGIQRGISHFLIISVCLSSLLFLCHCAYDRMRFLYDSLIKQTHKQTRAFTIKSAQTFNTITELDSVKFDQKYIQCFLLLYKYYEMLLCDTQALAQPTGEKIVPIVNLQCCGLASSLMD